LYIEPKKEEKSLSPVNDVYTLIMEKLLEIAVVGASKYNKLDDHNTFMPLNGWRGIHRTDCGQASTSRDYLLDSGYITNSLAVFYLRWYRSSIPESEMEKVKDAIDPYRVKYTE
jgi:hypothetical protein